MTNMRAAQGRHRRTDGLSGLRDKIRTMISAGQAPDLFSVDGTFKLADSRIPAKLNGLRAVSGRHRLGRNLHRRRAERRDAGRQRSTRFPFESAVFGIYYNTELLANAGYTEFPTTYDDMFAMADALKAQGVIAFPLMTGENAWTSMLWYSQILLASAGATDVYKNGLSTTRPSCRRRTCSRRCLTIRRATRSARARRWSNGHFLNFERRFTPTVRGFLRALPRRASTTSAAR
jgi:hypothetical protein